MTAIGIRRTGIRRAALAARWRRPVVPAGIAGT